MRARVLLADDHPVVAEGIRSMLENDFDVVGIASDGRALLEAARAVRPDVILTDISMPNLNGLEAIRNLRATEKRVKVVVLTMHADAHLAAKAFQAGASGYLLKTSTAEELVGAVREVLDGGVYLTPSIPRDLYDVLREGKTEADDALTPRQREVLQLVAEGRTMKEVAGILGISTRTAESHKYEMMRVLGVQTTAELVQHAVKTGLVAVARAAV
jgi:DNA-binding NarL/FixJ family response regulator